jgi:hypothetical protein
VLSQTPALQMAIPPAGASQACPHAPQFSGSELWFTQLAPQGLYPLSQLMLQAEPAHTAVPCCGMGHAMSQLPQWAAEVAVSTHAPLQLTAAV